ncbi:hypothetical protein L7F22_013367 [Adiantum nelumboides]|nr:hypothetical protein [Adiantum nelumboides]
MGVGAATSAKDEQQEEVGEVWREVFEWEVGFAVEEVWAVTSDFGQMHKWAPTLLASCAIVEGMPQQPGCVRLVQTHPPNASDALEKLLEFDPVLRKLSYVVVGSSVPFFIGLSPTFHLLPISSSPPSTKIVWSYSIQPPPCGLDQASLRNIVLSSLYEAMLWTFVVAIRKHWHHCRGMSFRVIASATTTSGGKGKCNLPPQVLWTSELVEGIVTKQCSVIRRLMANLALKEVFETRKQQDIAYACDKACLCRKAYEAI